MTWARGRRGIRVPRTGRALVAVLAGLLGVAVAAASPMAAPASRHPGIAVGTRPRTTMPHSNSVAPPQETTLTVSQPVTGISTSPPALSPAFSTSTHDYVLRCGSGTNTINFAIAAGSAGGLVSVPLAESQAAVVQDSTTAQYWIRCLPANFPDITVNKPGNPSPGWYTTSNITAANGDGAYAMVLDGNGTPVWFASTPGVAVNVEALPNNTLTWAPLTGPGLGTDPFGAFWLYPLNTEATQLQRATLPPTDPHELLQMSNGDRLMIASPLRAVNDIPASMAGANGTLIDCLVEEVKPDGSLAWSWDAYDHVAPSENTIPTVVANYNGQPAADVYHCNSIDVDPSAPDPTIGDLVVSMRNMDAVFRINRTIPATSGTITWKLGGTAANKDGAQHLTIASDPEGSIHGQHDARFQPSGDFSIYDDHTGAAGASRGVQYHVDTTAGTATMDLNLPSPDGQNARATGSFRRYQSGADNVIGWGSKGGVSMSEVDASNNLLMSITLGPAGTSAYRFIKYDLGALDINLLRNSAGAVPEPPHAGGTVVDGWGGLHNFGPGNVNTSGSAYWPGWDIARAVATRPDGSGGYTLDGWGGIHAFGNAPAIDDGSHAYWQGWDIARGIALCADGASGYTLDGWGGVHAFGGAAEIDDGSHAYWQGWDIARGIVVTPDCSGGYTLDGWGGIHNFGSTSPIADSSHAYWPGWDIANAIVLRPDGQTGYVLDGFGGVHGFGGIADPPISAYYPFWDIARGLTLAADDRSGYVLDGWGGLHSFGNAAPVADTTHAYWPGWDIARGAGGGS